MPRHEQRLLRHKLQNINAAYGSLCQHESLSQEVSPQFFACRVKASAVPVMLMLKAHHSSGAHSIACIGACNVTCIDGCICLRCWLHCWLHLLALLVAFACNVAHVHAALRSISCSQVAHQVSTAIATCEPRPRAQKRHQADLDQLQSPSRNGKHCQAGECAGIGGGACACSSASVGEPNNRQGPWPSLASQSRRSAGHAKRLAEALFMAADTTSMHLCISM